MGGIRRDDRVMEFKYVEISSPELKGAINLFWGDYPLALITNITVAQEIKESLNKSTNTNKTPKDANKPK